MADLQAADSPLLDVRVRVAHSRLFAASPSRVQILVQTLPNVRLRRAQAADVRLVIDVSGSMAAAGDSSGRSKLALVKTAALRFLDALADEDRLLVSVFSTDGRLVVPSTELVGRARARAAAAIAGLMPQSGTNISAGLELALEPPTDNAVPLALLFTDGESCPDPDRDHAALVQLADRMRDARIPLSIYGTGASYNWSLLRQLAVRAGYGSSCRHVLSVEQLEGYLLGELAQLRGTAVDRVELTGQAAAGVKIVRVHSTLPTIHEVDIAPERFTDRVGGVNPLTAAVHLIELELDHPMVGVRELLTLRYRARSRKTLQTVDVTLPPVGVEFVADVAQQSPIDEEVRRIALKVAAAEQAECGEFNAAERLFRRAGDYTTADAMATMAASAVDMGADVEEWRRSASSVASMSASWMPAMGSDSEGS